MKEYKIIEADDLWRLERAVNRNIQEGWEPVGGALFLYPADRTYIQSMTRETKS